MPPLDPQKAEEFAVNVVARLREAGFEAYWAGGCVRDRLMGRIAKDYDVATSAPPDEVRRIFGFRRTLPIGASFGVITVLGPKGSGQIEVATFRQDQGYSDGRRPDAVTYSTAEADAQRRDFTINGLFYDPVSKTIRDFVGGQEDLQRGVIRAIGNPHERFAEDKLRLLRAIRFAATFGFQLDSATRTAVEQHAAELSVVSSERIAAEMRRMLTHASRGTALVLLHETRLLAEVLPEAERMALAADATSGSSPWQRTLDVLSRLSEPSFPLALAALLREVDVDHDPLVRALTQRWRLANEEAERTRWLLEHEPVVRTARTVPWPRLQRVLIHPGAWELVEFAAAVAPVWHEGEEGVAYSREKLALPADVLNPPPLVTGDDLITSGLKPGVRFKSLLEALRDAQLEGRIGTRAEALQLAREMAAS